VEEEDTNVDLGRVSLDGDEDDDDNEEEKDDDDDTPLETDCGVRTH
jgi:hypothetical protein